jgi:hypothetical protein
MATRCSAALHAAARSAEAQCFCNAPQRWSAVIFGPTAARCSAAAWGLNGQRSAAAARKEARICPFLSKFRKNKLIYSFFNRKLLYRCSACVFELPLQRCAAALVYFSTAAQRCSGEAQRCSASTPAALKRAALRISRSAALRCSAKRAALQFEKKWPSLGIVTAP